MALKINSIGQFEFISLAGNPVPPSEQMDGPIWRKGVDGNAVWKTGKRGDKFTLRSKVDMVDLDEARKKFHEYTALQDDDPVVLVKNDYDYNAHEDWKVKVLEVRETVCEARGTSTGGLNPPSGAFLAAEWDLVAIENQAEA